MLDDNREETISRINSKLPSCIKVQYIKKVTKNFNCKSACDGRTYLYLLPTFAFAPLVPIDDAKGKLLFHKNAHTVILPEWTIANGGLSSFAFQSFWGVIGAQNKKIFFFLWGILDGRT